MDVYWLEQAESEIPAHDQWLSVRDAACLGGLRFAKRRADWRLGRWTAKRALAIYWKIPTDPKTLSEIEIRPAPARRRHFLRMNQRTLLFRSVTGPMLRVAPSQSPEDYWGLIWKSPSVAARLLSVIISPPTSRDLLRTWTRQTGLS